MLDDPFIIKVTSFIKPLPSVADRVLYLARQDPVDFKELTRVIETDPALSTMIVSLANSPLYMVQSRPTDSLKKAILLLGQSRIIDSVMAYMTRSIREDTTEKWPSGDIEYWKHCIAVAICARMLAEKMQIPAAPKCFIAGLIHDVGKLALLNYEPTTYKQVLNDVQGARVSIEYSELGAFGVTHANLSGFISRRWKLPTHFLNAISFHHDRPDSISGTLANIVRSANLLAKIANIGDSGNPFNMIDGDLLVPHPRIGPEDIIDILTRLPEFVDEMSTLILGRAAASPRDLREEAKAELYVRVQVGNGDNRTLLRYIASSLGYRTTPGDTDESENEVVVSIMDYMPGEAAENEHIIDFSAWINEQRKLPAQQIDVIALRAWMADQLDGVLSEIA